MARWVSPQEALEALASAHDLARRYANYEKCLQAAEETIMRRLTLGQLPSTSGGAQIESGSGEVEISVDPGDELPTLFWQRWIWASGLRNADWVAGDFHFESNLDFASPEGTAFGVRFDADALPWMNSDAPAIQSTRVPELESLPTRSPGAPVRYDSATALTYLAALAHASPNGLCEPAQSEPSERGIARLLEPWAESTFGKNAGPQEGWRRNIGKRVLNEIQSQERLKSKGGTNSGGN